MLLTGPSEFLVEPTGGNLVRGELVARVPEAGGPYAYVNVAFGPLIAFIVAWGYWISVWSAMAAIAVATAASV